MKWQDEISVDPAICHGQPCFKGTRVLVHVVLDNLAVDMPVDRILQEYPSLSSASVRAAISGVLRYLFSTARMTVWRSWERLRPAALASRMSGSNCWRRRWMAFWRCCWGEMGMG
jgi:uncharacterized protein (DUF433 family)